MDAVIRLWEEAGRHIPTQDQIDIACAMAGRHKGDASASEALKELLLPLGIGLWKISEEITVVGWAGDPRAKSILATGLEELPELLVNEDLGVRLLAGWKLDSLTNK